METSQLAAPLPRAGAAEQQAIRRVATGTAANLAGAVVAGACGLGLTIVVTRSLSQSSAGVFFAATSIFILISTLSQLGTATGLVYFISRCRALATRDLIARYLKAALGPVLVASALCGMALFISASRLAELTTPGDVGTTTGYLRVFALFIPLAALENVWLSSTRGMGTMRANALIEQVARPVLQLVLVGAVILAGSSAISWAWAFSYAPAALAAWLWWQKMSYQGAKTRRHHPQALVREFWKFTLPRSASNVIQILMQRFDIVLVAALAGVANAAIYAAATRLVVAGQIGTTAVGRAAQPQLGHSLALGDRAATNHVYQTSTAWLMLVTWPIFLTLISFQETVLRVFGDGYSAGSVVMIVLCLSMLVGTGFGLVDMMLAMAGKTTWNLANALVALSMNIVLDVWLVPMYGVLGAAIGWAAAILTQNTLALVQVGFAMRLHPFGGLTMSAAGLTGLCFFFIPFLVRLAFGQTLAGLAVGGSIGAISYAVGLWRLRGVLRLNALRPARKISRGGPV